MPKNIVLFSDGTGNSSAHLFKTNVWRLYQALDLADPKVPTEPRQFAYYDDGVGTSSFKPLAVLGGAIGVGLARNVRDVYAFLCRTYEPGDRIYAFGFSRGAFTIRVLVGLVMSQGLVPYEGNEADLERYAGAAYRAYRKKYDTTGGLVGPVRWLRDTLIDAWDGLLGRPHYREIERIGAPAPPGDQAPGRVPPITIEFLGLWDTVDAYGLPIDELTRAVDSFIWPLTMRDLNLNPRVKRARHALALDDERNTFHPRLWRIDQLTRTKDVGVSRTKVHESVFRRIQVGQDGYAPFVLPPGFAVVAIDGRIVDGSRYLGAGIGEGSGFQSQREHVWNWVWWRRVTYFATFFLTGGLALMPIVVPALRKGACESRLCFVSDLIGTLGLFLPGVASTWLDSFTSRPDVFVVLAALVVAGLWVGGVLERRIRDEMRRVWYGFGRLNPSPHVKLTPVTQPGRFNRLIEWLRQRPVYQSFFRVLTHGVLPTVFLLVLGYGAVALLTQAVFAIRSAGGGVCVESADTLRDVDGVAMARPFRTNALCASTGLTLEKGATYRLSITIPAGDPWTDSGIAAGPNGVRPKDTTYAMTAFVLLRRHLGQPWYKPYARIGTTGSDEYPLDPKPSLADGKSPERPSSRPYTCGGAAKPNAIPNQADITFESEIVARTSGELFLYVNDALLGFPGLTSFFYCNNEGGASATVERLTEAAKSPPSRADGRRPRRP